MKAVWLNVAHGSPTLVDADIAFGIGDGSLTQAFPGYVRYKREMLHRLIVGAPVGEVVDHINGDTLDNRRSNLRVCSRAENLWNAGKRRHNTSGFKGVCFDKRDGRWYARIRAVGRVHDLGRYKTAEEAAMAYDAKAAELHGPFARLNFPSVAGSSSQ